MHRLSLLGVSCLLIAATSTSSKLVISPALVGGENRLLTHVSTDKPVYKAGETVFVRGVVLDANSHLPAGQMGALVTVKGPKGETLSSGNSAVVDGSFGFSWPVPEGTAGGEFKVLASPPGAAPGERKFDVRVYRAPRLKNQIVFARDGYGEGDTLTATLETLRAEGGIPTGAKITAVARVDGVDVATAPCVLDATGHCTVELKLPKHIERGEGTIAFTISDGGVVETATKTIPLLVSTFEIALYPEGGELVAGLNGRVYVEARTLSQKPADIAGVIVNSNGAEVSAFRTEHEGRGRFMLTPLKGESYTLKVTKPASTKKTLALPKVKNSGVVLTLQGDVVAAGQPVKAIVASTSSDKLTVTLRQRDVVLSTAFITPRGITPPIATLDAKGAEGVLVVTVTDADGTPIAERLVFRESAKQLTIKLEGDRPRYVPGASVSLKVKTLVDGKPAAAFVGLTVTDDAVRELIEKREQSPSLPVMVMLEDDVKELADAQVYLDASNPNAKLATDLLLGTQGWRRFAFQNVNDFIAREQDRAKRAMAFMAQQENGTFGIDEEDTMAAALKGGGPAGLRAPAAPRAMAAGNAMPPAMPGAVPKPAPALAPMPAAAAAVADAERMPLPAAAPAVERAQAPQEFQMEKRGRVMDPQQLIVIREYAHKARPNRGANDRIDFAETLYWSVATKTNEKGEATVRFDTSDSVTSFRAQAGGYTAAGALGAADITLDSVKPFYVEAKLPLEVTEGDLIRLPVAFVNGTREPLTSVSMSMNTKADLRFAAPAAFSLKADERARKVIDVVVGPKSRTTSLTLNTTAGGYSDVVTRDLSIKAKGFPIEQAGGGLLMANGKARFEVTLAKDTVRGSVQAHMVIYPAPTGNLTAALKSMIREPSGCFEQTSSTVYPMTMALQYFKTHSGADPAMVKDAETKLESGTKRLTGFECKQRGYEWFGEDPGHEALTAYGLLEFTDMSKVRAIDQAMLARTKAWLLEQRDGKGGFNRKRRALHTWVEDKDVSDAYITWALLESGEKNLKAEVKHVVDAALESSNSYVWAVGANVAQLGGDAARATTLLQKLVAAQDAKGFVSGGKQSIVGSTGESLAIETTSFAALAWFRAGPEYVAAVEKSIKGLLESSKGGSYGSTQSTVLALKVVLEYDRQRSTGRKSGSVRLMVDGKPLGAPVKYDGTTQNEVELPDASELLSSGAHVLALVQEGGGQIPWSAIVRSNRVQPQSSAETKVSLEVQLPSSQMKEGDVVEATARVTNVTDAQLPTVVAIIGVPGGLEPRIDQLKELVKAKTIDAYEIMGRDVVLYWRGMTPKQQVRVPVSLVASVPGKYTGPASRAYLYYGNEHKTWVAGLSADVAAK